MLRVRNHNGRFKLIADAMPVAPLLPVRYFGDIPNFPLPLRMYEVQENIVTLDAEAAPLKYVIANSSGVVRWAATEAFLIGVTVDFGSRLGFEEELRFEAGLEALFASDLSWIQPSNQQILAALPELGHQVNFLNIGADGTHIVQAWLSGGVLSWRHMRAEEVLAEEVSP